MNLKPREFINLVFITELSDIVEHHPYIAFMLMGAGLEFLGKCISGKDSHWHVVGKSRRDFEKSVRQLAALKKYKPYLSKTSYDLYGSLRCGLIHSGKPKYKITLSSKNEMAHLIEHNGRLNLRCEDFYSDFKQACEEVISRTYPAGDKMNSGFIHIPSHA
jgi:hypothetical protein